jgi:hypothetical protein
MAALDRQHPRDLFDVMILLQNEGISDGLFKTWLAYLISHKGSMAEALNPNRKNVEALFHGQFVTMTERGVSLEQLLEVRERLIVELRSRIGETEKQFLLSGQAAGTEMGTARSARRGSASGSEVEAA